MITKKIIPILLLLAIAVTLLNSNAYGAASLIAYFFYTIVATFTAILIFSIALAKKRSFPTLPTYIHIFLVLALYIFFHGIITNTMGLTHYYWATHTLFLISVHTWKHERQVQIGTNKPFLFLHKGILFLSFIESIIVLLQCMHIFPVPNKLFLCTGTWGNPNVTALFLALSLFAILPLRQVNSKKLQQVWITVVLITILLAVAMLQCRTAYIIALVFIATKYGKLIYQYFFKHRKFDLKKLAVMLSILMTSLIVISVFNSKQESTNARIQIWKNSIELIVQKPLTGHGFGLFEKSYNLFAANQQNKINDHINMPYNDFLELGVEGGLVAMILWIMFLISLLKIVYKNRASAGYILPVTIAFILLQLTNFGFQAIPVMVLFLLFTANETTITSNIIDEKIKYKKYHKYASVLYSTSGFIVAIVLFYHMTGLHTLFYKKWIISKKAPPQQAIAMYRQWYKELDHYTSYHENIADACMSLEQYKPALDQYKKALRTSSNPELLVKCGYSCQLLGLYDSSAYYYTIVQHMQPQRFIPRLALLRLYKQQKDTSLMLAKAKEIIDMPVKIKSRKVEEIKAYAAFTIATIDSVRKKII